MKKNGRLDDLLENMEETVVPLSGKQMCFFVGLMMEYYGYLDAYHGIFLSCIPSGHVTSSARYLVGQFLELAILMSF